MSDSEDSSGEEEATQFYQDTASSDDQDSKWWLSPTAWEQTVEDARLANEADQVDVDARTTEILNNLPDASSEDKVKITDAIKNADSGIVKSLLNRYTTSGGVTDWLKVGKDLLTAGVAYDAYKQAAAGTPKTGYQGGVPSYKVVRSQLAPTGIAAARPGAGGQRYFTDTRYATESGLPAAEAANTAQKTTLENQNLYGAQFQGRAPSVEDLYSTYLNRPSDQEGADYWKGRFGNTVDANEAASFRAAAALEKPTPTPIATSNTVSPAQQAASDKFFGVVPKAAPTAAPVVQNAAQGGLMGLAKGGSTTKPGGTYLQGNTDGMADKLHATIDGNQPARLAHGEFVIPADVVSHLGNGNSDAGAKQLYKMMDKIRQARTGNKKQGRKINPEKFTPGGIAGYAAGGSVQHFVAGGTTGIASNAASGVTGTESSLSNWVGPTVTDVLAKGTALSETPYQAYTGPLTAGESSLQTKAFGNAANLAVPTSIGEAANTAGAVGTKMGNLSYAGNTATNQFAAPDKYDATTFGSETFGTDQAKQYMNPYLQGSLDPQLAEARRQAEISRVSQAGQMTRAGAFGGSRQAISESEGYRNLGTNLANITGKGYDTAFTNAQQQFNADQARKAAAATASEQSKQFGATQGLTAAQAAAQYGQAAQAQTEQSKQFGANYGLQALQGQLGAAQTQGQLGGLQAQTGLANLQAQMAAGAQQRGITAEGVAADKTAFEEERDNPFKMVQYQRSLLQGLPLEAQSYSITNNPISAAANAAGAIRTGIDLVSGGPAPKYDAQTGKLLAP
jgi:hypothetical protein